VSKHVKVHWKIETRFLACALDHLCQPRPRKRRAAFGGKYEPAFWPIPTQLPQRSDFITVERVRRRYAILLPTYVD
jgi:hypothetical protein